MNPRVGILTSPARFPAETYGFWPEESSRFLRYYAVWEFNAFCWISLFVVTYVLFVRVFELFKLWFQARKLTGPPCDGFSGHSALLSGANLTDVISNTHEKYGSIVKLWLSPASLLVSIKDPELIKQVLLKAEDKLPVGRKVLRMAFGRSCLFASSFDELQERRQLLTAEFDRRSLEIANGLPSKLLGSIIGQMNLAGGGLDCNVVAQHMAFTLLGSLLYGEAFLGWNKATIYKDMLLKIVEGSRFCTSYRITPIWNREFWRYRKLCTTYKCLTNDILQRCRMCCMLPSSADERSHDKPDGSEVEHYHGVPNQTTGLSFSGSVLDYGSSKQFNGHPDPREELYGNITTVMFHGFFTTADLIGNVLASLVAHPEIQNELYSEMVALRKASTKQDEHDVHHMHLLLATIYESARLQPARPLLQRCLKHDLCLKNGTTIPAGAIVVVPVQLVQTDPSIWGCDATKFNPYRFLSQASDTVHDSSLTGSQKDEGETSPAKFVLKDPKEDITLLSFGGGLRSCLGEKFVIQGVASLLASLLEHYEIKSQPGSKQKQEPSQAGDNYVIRLPQNPEIALVPRTN
ncbi:PREDICTED: cytochrome P450 4A25-like [Tarenaya hassleriana]|uniref:cytochrome P450 4A25-like n=1 Tax=Tarenaya hassleriana TaxID=28532 RepID=UPI00053CA6ED|nr:PREDICTED: cytochrome P450 4A25-like [Tarenaya hassleriana]